MARKGESDMGNGLAWMKKEATELGVLWIGVFVCPYTALLLSYHIVTVSTLQAAIYVC